MKVLFAVSSESISDAIIKRYQKEYKEILSYKNVYYFNAILKEIQKDKTYDRIVISEDLEPFSNNNYDTIDKFIFEKLDNISDEAQDSQGKETSIVLICTDRRTKGSAFLVKIFGIGIYNALLGNDRSMDAVCKLINKPRVKKEAKLYYKIDADDVSYDPKSEREVSELEIQNILTHFKKLGKNTDKYADSFDNIVSQYTDEQLKIIINCLPMNVKAVLEVSSPKYQEIMSINGNMQKIGNSKLQNKSNQVKTGIKIDILENKLNQTKMSGPIVIPSSVRNAKHKVINPVKSAQNAEETMQSNRTNVKNTATTKVVKNVAKVAQPVQEVTNTQKALKTNSTTPNVKATQRLVKSKAMAKQSIKEAVAEKEDMLLDLEAVQKKMNDETISELDTIEKEKSGEVDAMVPEFKNEDALLIDENVEKVVKKGRGRPRKNPEPMVQKTKGKRGRPKKDANQEIIDANLTLEDDEVILPGIDTMKEDEIEDDLLPGLDETNAYEEATLPGLDDLEAYEEDDDIEDALPEFEEIEEGEEYEEEDSPIADVASEIEDDLLPGIEEQTSETYGEDDDIEEDDDYTDEVSLPGLDDLEEYEEDDSSMEDMAYDVEDDLLPGIEEQTSEAYEEDDDAGDMLPGFEEVAEEEEDVLSQLDTDDQNTTYNDSDMLPGFDADYEETDTSYKQNDDYNENNSIESIKPQVDYSMSSLNSLLTKDKKIVTFIGTTKNGTSFLINNLAALFSSAGINTAILDMTQNRNSYYIYTKNEEALRKIAYTSIEKLQNGFAEGIKVDKNLTVYTALPNDGKVYTNVESILSTLVQNHSLVLIDCDFETDPSYFASCQEIYLVQSMDILTIQPLTSFLRDLKAKGVLESEKVRVVINKEIKVRSLTSKIIIGGMSFYNDPAMSFMTELFNKDMVKACSIPFEDNAYSKYLDAMVNCNVSLNGYSKAFLSKLRILGDMVYPLVSKQTYGKQTQDYSKNVFSNNMNNTLRQMKNKY